MLFFNVINIIVLIILLFSFQNTFNPITRRPFERRGDSSEESDEMGSDDFWVGLTKDPRTLNQTASIDTRREGWKWLDQTPYIYNSNSSLM